MGQSPSVNGSSSPRKLWTREEFIRWYALEGLTNIEVVRCACGQGYCRGWQVVRAGQAPLFPVPEE